MKLQPQYSQQEANGKSSDQLVKNK